MYVMTIAGQWISLILRLWEDMKECLDALSEIDVLSEKSTNSFDDVPDSYKEGFIIPEELRQKVEVEVLI